MSQIDKGLESATAPLLENTGVDSTRAFWYGILRYYLSISRPAAAAVSAYGMFLAMQSLSTVLAKVMVRDSDYPIQGPAQVGVDSAIGVISGLTFFGMASGAYFAQSFRLQGTIDKLIQGKFKFAHIHPLLMVSNILYGALIGFMTVSSFVGLFTAVSNTLPLFITGAVLGGIFGLGYGLLTINYNLDSIHEYELKISKNDPSTRANFGEWALFLFGSMLGQFALNIYVPAQGVAKFANQSWSKPAIIFPMIGWTASTAIGIIRSQQTSFFKNSRQPGGILGNTYRRQVGMPLSQVGARIRLVSYLNRIICNFAVLMMIPSNGNALAQICLNIINLALAASSKALLPDWSFLPLFGLGMAVAFNNSMGYLAFNTELGKAVCDWFLLTKRIPKIAESVFFTGLYTFENNIEGMRKHYELNSASVMHSFERALVEAANQIWQAIKADKEPLQATINEFKAAHENQLLLPEYAFAYLIEQALQKVWDAPTQQEIKLVGTVLKLKEQAWLGKLKPEQVTQVEEIWQLIQLESREAFNKRMPVINESQKLTPQNVLAHLSTPPTADDATVFLTCVNNDDSAAQALAMG